MITLFYLDFFWFLIYMFYIEKNLKPKIKKKYICEYNSGALTIEVNIFEYVFERCECICFFM